MPSDWSDPEVRAKRKLYRLANRERINKMQRASRAKRRNAFVSHDFKLPGEPTTTRKCLKCKSNFESSWIGHRICNACKYTRIYESAHSQTRSVWPNATL